MAIFLIALVASLVPPAHSADRIIWRTVYSDCASNLPIHAALHKTNCYVSLTNPPGVFFQHHMMQSDKHLA
jgi:hypothetical protein